MGRTADTGIPGRIAERQDSMTTMEWIEVDQEQSDWKRQINIMAYYGRQIIGSIVYGNSGWESVIDDCMDFLDAETEEDAKREMIERLEEHFEDKVNYYCELIDSLGELNP